MIALIRMHTLLCLVHRSSSHFRFGCLLRTWASRASGDRTCPYVNCFVPIKFSCQMSCAHIHQCRDGGFPSCLQR
ncbi:hypothetical protein BDZ97DRAFT_176728 [Flammula alnicola]|nr:hypothetical protein BDZ97DRAFT_176728 [Flammula alnicola]